MNDLALAGPGSPDRPDRHHREKQALRAFQPEAGNDVPPRCHRSATMRVDSGSAISANVLDMVM